MADLLVEIGTEELPARRVRDAAEALREGLAAALVEAGLLEGWKPEGRPILGTPRRLAAFVPGVKERQADREERAWGPPASAAIGSDGKPTKAGEGFAKTVGVAFTDLKHGEKVAGKPPYLYADRVVKGRAAAEVIAAALPKVVASLPFKRTMRWPQSDMVFARPIRNLVVLLGGAVVPCRVAGVEAGRTTRGHAFLEPKPFEIPKADLAEYVALLRKAKVLVDFADRAAEIEKQVRGARAGAPASGGKGPWGEADDELLPEVAGLVEWPRALVGSFDERYRDLPPALLVTAMAHHLRYFPIAGEDGRPRGFVSVTDREERHADSIREGNERVLRARLYDAAFFFANDKSKNIEFFFEALKNIDFHRELGSLWDKCERVDRTSMSLAGALSNLSGGHHVPKPLAPAQSQLLKFDLATEVVREFPELQGQIGSYYATLRGYDESVAAAIEAQYEPRGEWHSSLDNDTAALVSLSEKVDTILALFWAGEEPTGSADPFALRRSAIGALRIVERKGWNLSIGNLVGHGSREFDNKPKRVPDYQDKAIAFLLARAKQEARSRGFTDFLETIDSSIRRPYPELWGRLKALKTLSGMPNWVNLIALVERTGNMGKQSAPLPLDPSWPREVVELHQAVREVGSASWFLKAATGNAPAQVRDLVAFGEGFVAHYGTPVSRLFENVVVDNPKEPKLQAAIKGMLYSVFEQFQDRLGDLRNLGSGARPPRE